jgi:hypothetical protein
MVRFYHTFGDIEGKLWRVECTKCERKNIMGSPGAAGLLHARSLYRHHPTVPPMVTPSYGDVVKRHFHLS